MLDAALAHAQFGREASNAYFEDPGSFTDATGWKSAALIELGRNDEAMAAISTFCGRCALRARLDMSLADMMIDAGRPAEAIPILESDRPEGLDVKGVAELVEMKACAYHLVGRDAEASAQLDTLRENQTRAPAPFLDGLLCMGTDDEIASTLVSRLADPILRSVALSDLQVYREGKLMPLNQKMRDRLRVAAARPDVQTALAKVGRSVTYDMPNYGSVS